MAFDVTNLSAHVEPIDKNISVRSVMDAKTPQILKAAGSFQAGVKGQAALLKMDSTIVLQGADSCGRTPNGTTTLSDLKIEVVPIKSEENLCPKVLKNTYYAYAVTSGGSVDDEQFTGDFVKMIADTKIHDVSYAVENLMWKGDKSLTGTNNLKHIDGFLKQAVAGGTASYIDTSNDGETVIEQLQKSFLEMPIAVRSQEDFRVALGQDKYDEYLMELANADYVNSQENTKIIGTSAILIPTPGLDGTNKIFSARLSNLQMAMDLEDEQDKASFHYSKEQNIVFFDIYTSIGVKIIRTNEVGVGTFN